MKLNLKSFVLASMAGAALTGSTAAAERSNQLRGADYSSDGINRHLQATTGATYIPPGGANYEANLSVGDGTGATYTAPSDSCPVKITLNSGGGPVKNGKCRDTGGKCAYRIDNKMYAECDCIKRGGRKMAGNKSKGGGKGGSSKSKGGNKSASNKSKGSGNNSEWQCFPNP